MRAFVLAPLFCLPAMAEAACLGDTFVSCTVENGKQLEVCIQPGDFTGNGGFTYAFGPAGAPEIQLSVPMSAYTVEPWSGFGRSIWAAVGFPNAEVTYLVWHSFDRLGGDENGNDASLEAGVEVRQNDATIASFACRPGGQIAPVFTLEDEMTAAGYCWNRDSFAWQRGNCG